MKHKYGTFTDEQIRENSKEMHSDVHKLLLYKDGNIKQEIFKSEEEFRSYFNNLLYRFGGMNDLLNCPVEMVELLSTLQSAYNMACSKKFNYCEYRRLILDAHGYIKDIFEKMED